MLRPGLRGAGVVRGAVQFPLPGRPGTLFCGTGGVPGLWGVDTRELTRIIREHGVMNAAICDEVPADLTAVKTYAVTGVVEAVTCRESSIHPASGEERFRVSLLDYGAKRNIVRELQNRGCTVTVLPAQRRRRRFWRQAPTGSCSPMALGTRRRMSSKLSRFKSSWAGCHVRYLAWGHQLTALAAGGSTYKLKYGHRG